MGAEYTPVFLLFLVSLAVAGGMIATALLGPRKSSAVKQMPYESGMDPIGDARQRFDVRYYLVAIVFLLFDVELLFLYPWAVAQWSVDAPVGASGTAAASGVGIPVAFRGLVFGEILVFVAVLAAAFAYAWKKGVFEWR
jgi:NADH-quinone oxidoreductase subunit A